MDDKERFLIEHHALAKSHSKRSLFAHLTGTRALLIDWHVDVPVSDAGLFHAVYGTESFPKPIMPLALRDAVRAVIGDEAEFLAFVFGAMTKESFYANLDRSEGYHIISRVDGSDIPLGATQYDALCHIFVANWLEQRERVAPEHRFIRAAEFRTIAGRLNPLARAALAEAYGFGLP
jgi:hypothetical protein